MSVARFVRTDLYQYFSRYTKLSCKSMPAQFCSHKYKYLFRPGTLIVEFEVEFDNDPAVTSDLTDINVKLVNGEIAITVYNQTASATFIEIGDAAGKYTVLSHFVNHSLEI